MNAVKIPMGRDQKIALVAHDNRETHPRLQEPQYRFLNRQRRARRARLGTGRLIPPFFPCMTHQSERRDAGAPSPVPTATPAQLDRERASRDLRPALARVDTDRLAAGVQALLIPFVVFNTAYVVCILRYMLRALHAARESTPPPRRPSTAVALPPRMSIALPMPFCATASARPSSASAHDWAAAPPTPSTRFSTPGGSASPAGSTPAPPPCTDSRNRCSWRQRACGCRPSMKRAGEPRRNTAQERRR